MAFAKMDDIPNKIGMVNGQKDLSATELLEAAGKFLPPERVAGLKRELADGMRQKQAQAAADAERLARELQEFLGDEKPAQPLQRVPRGIAPLSEVEAPPPGLSIKKLVAFFAQRRPGATAGDFVNFIRAHRPELNMKGVHSELHRASRAGGTLRRDGEKPNSKYYPVVSEGSTRR